MGQLLSFFGYVYCPPLPSCRSAIAYTRNVHNDFLNGFNARSFGIDFFRNSVSLSVTYSIGIYIVYPSCWDDDDYNDVERGVFDVVEAAAVSTAVVLVVEKEEAKGSFG